MYHTSDPAYNVDFWYTGKVSHDLLPRWDTQRHFQWSQLVSFFAGFERAKAATRDEVTMALKTETLDQTYQQLKELQRQHRSSRECFEGCQRARTPILYVRIPDDQVTASFVLAAFHVHMDGLSVNMEPANVPRLRFHLTDRGMEPEHVMPCWWHVHTFMRLFDVSADGCHHVGHRKRIQGRRRVVTSPIWVPYWNFLRFNSQRMPVHLHRKFSPNSSLPVRTKTQIQMKRGRYLGVHQSPRIPLHLHRTLPPTFLRKIRTEMTRSQYLDHPKDLGI